MKNRKYTKVIEQWSALDNLIMTLRDTTHKLSHNIYNIYTHTNTYTYRWNFGRDVLGDGWWLWCGGGGGEFVRIDKEAGNGDGGD